MATTYNDATSVSALRWFQYDLPSNPKRPNCEMGFQDWVRTSDGRRMPVGEWRKLPYEAQDDPKVRVVEDIDGSDAFRDAIFGEFEVQEIQHEHAVGVYAILLDPKGKSLGAIAKRITEIAHGVGFRDE